MRLVHVVLGVLIGFLTLSPKDAFQPVVTTRFRSFLPQQTRKSRFRTELSLAQQDDPQFSTQVRLREEAESPFRKVRFFFYIAIAAAAATSLFVSVARIAAGLGGINEDLMTESLVNAGVDTTGLVVIYSLWQRDAKAEESRLKRATKGAELAKLSIRGSTNLLGGSDSSGATTTTRSLADLRRGRGIEKRVVICMGGKERIQQVMDDAENLQKSLDMNDLVVVPVLLPGGDAPTLGGMPECVALPVGSSWGKLAKDETKDAIEQGVNVTKDGISIVLKKNGRVGQRTRGIFLGRMVGEVEERRDAGMDVSNI